MEGELHEQQQSRLGFATPALRVVSHPKDLQKRENQNPMRLVLDQLGIVRRIILLRPGLAQKGQQT